MNWINPIALWGLTALVIPIVIHLWSKNKTKTIAFGSIRFLNESSTLKSKKIQLSELPLLFLRLLILALLVALMANWITSQKVENHKALLLGKGIEVPQAYSQQGTAVFRASDFENDAVSNHYYLLQEFQSKHPEVDSLIYIDDFKGTDFMGAIPHLNFHLELIKAHQASVPKQQLSTDTIVIHFDSVPKKTEQRIHNMLKANHLYTQGKVNNKESNREAADLLITDSPQKLAVNQIVLSDTLSSNYQLHRKHSYSLLYLNTKWMDEPLNEDRLLLVFSEYIAQMIEPNYQYSSFEQIYTRSSAHSLEAYQSRSYAEELLWVIVFLLMAERYFSYRKRYA